MHDSPSRFKRYLWMVIVCGLTVLACLLRGLVRVEVVIASTFAVGVGALEIIRFVLPGGEAMSASSGLVLMVLWLYGLPVAALCYAVAMLGSGLIRRGLMINVLFNIAQLTLSLTAAAFVFDALTGIHDGGYLLRAAGSLASGIVFYICNSIFLERALALYKRAPFLRLWWESFRQYGPRFSAPLMFAVLLLAIYPHMGNLLLFVTMVLILAQYVLLRRLAAGSQERAVTSLLELTAQRDAFRPGHSDRVLRYCSAIARELGLRVQDTRILRYAALLHDVGMALLPDNVLEKECALAAEDRVQVERHPVEGARLLARFATLVPVSRIVRHHHEWYNGSGYPDRLAGEQIPIGSRILSVADAFDAMTTDQPHRRAFTSQGAIEELRRLVGVQFDEEVVAALGQALDADSNLADFVSVRGRQDVDEEIAATIRHLREYVATPVQVGNIRRPIPGCPSEDENVLTEVRRRAAGILALYDLGRVINSSLSLHEVLDLVVRTAGRTVNARCAILLLDGDTGVLSFAACHGFVTERCRLPGLAAGEGPWGESLRTGRQVAAYEQCPARLPGPLQAIVTAEGLVSFLFMPLVAKGRPIGLMCLGHGEVHRFSEQEQNVLSVIASQAALAIENAKLYSETKERLEQISAMKQFTDAILDSVNTGIAVVDETGRVKLTNRVAREIALTLEPTLASSGRSWGDSRLFSELDRIVPMVELLRTGRPLQGDRAEIRTVDGKMIIEAQASAFTDQRGRRTGVIVVFRDVTEKARLESEAARAQQLALVGEIAAGAAHEIRNPLTAIRGFIQVLEDRQSTGRDREYVDIVVSEIDRIDGLLGELLLLARPPALKIEAWDLHQLLDEQCLMIRGESGASGVTVLRSYDPRCPWLHGDRQQVRQVVLNLFRNAIQAMSGSGTLTVTTRYSPRTDEVELRIADNGVGILPADLSRVFTPFFTTKEGGTGLGLSVSNTIVHNHGGRIDVESLPGGGAVFAVWLPVRPVLADEAHRQEGLARQV